MAIDWTMGVDCGKNLALAGRIVQQFDSLSISLPDGVSIKCKAHAETHRIIHFVCVHARDMGTHTFLENERQPDLANEQTTALVRDLLYAELRAFLGFRRAMFGAECFDLMSNATAEEDSAVDYGGMISSIPDFPDPPPDCVCEPFADGYRIVTSCRAASDSSATDKSTTAFVSEKTQKLQSVNSADRESAAEDLYRLGPAASAAMPALLNALIVEPDACPWVGTAVSQLHLSRSDIPLLRVALRSSNSHVRFWAARACVQLGESARPLIDELIKLLCDPHHPASDSAIWALGTIGARSIPNLIAAATGQDATLRAMAVLALGRYAEDIELRLPTVCKALDDADIHVRKCAARAVCYLGQLLHRNTQTIARTTIDTLIESLERISSDSTLESDATWAQRVLGWLKDAG